MVPKDLQETNKELDTILNTIQDAESYKVKKRLLKTQNNLRVCKPVYEKGLCALCRSTKKNIVDSKLNLCETCKRYCREHIIKDIGYYDRRKVIDLIIKLKQPVPCRFFDICGNMVDRLSEPGKVKKIFICDKCRPIWDDGRDFVMRKRNTTRRDMR